MISLLKILFALRALGITFTQVGELLKRVGTEAGPSNLDGFAATDTGRSGVTQDSFNPERVEDEEPEERQGKLL